MNTNSNTLQGTPNTAEQKKEYIQAAKLDKGSTISQGESWKRKRSAIALQNFTRSAKDFKDSIENVLT